MNQSLCQEDCPHFKKHEYVPKLDGAYCFSKGFPMPLEKKDEFSYWRTWMCRQNIDISKKV
jgi:hypothetical protein